MKLIRKIKDRLSNDIYDCAGKTIVLTYVNKENIVEAFYRLGMPGDKLWIIGNMRFSDKQYYIGHGGSHSVTIYKDI